MSPLGERVCRRLAELEQALARLDARDTIERSAIEQALAAGTALATGDLEHPGDIVGRDLSLWLERHAYLGTAAPLAMPSEHDDAVTNRLAR